MKKQLVHPKDKLDFNQKSGVIYHLSCNMCSSDYIGETERSLKTRTQEHQRRSSAPQSPVAQHILDTSHKLSSKNTKVLDTEKDWHRRGIKEALYIRKHTPVLNRDSGRYNLSHAWDNILMRQ